MQVYYDLKDFARLNNAVVTSGTFDGVHKGHQKIIKRLKEIASSSLGETVLITYWPHPRKVLSGGKDAPKILYTLEERIEIISKFGLDHLVVLQFTPEFSQISSGEFIQKILVDTIGTKKLVIGYDHHFGKNREGSFEYLVQNCHKYGFEVEEIPREDIDHLAISSSAIRKALGEGDLETANKLLGQPFHLKGTVAMGNQLGRTIGYPTANISLRDEDKIIPKDGVYAVKVKVNGEEKKAMMNIGYRPTVEGRTRTIEVNIFDFNEDIYDKEIEVSFFHYLRDEVKFNGIDALKDQLSRDKDNALKKLANTL